MLVQSRKYLTNAHFEARIVDIHRVVPFPNLTIDAPGDFGDPRAALGPGIWVIRGVVSSDQPLTS